MGTVRNHPYSLTALFLSATEVGIVFGLTSSAYLVPGSAMAKRLVRENLSLSIVSMILCAVAAARERPKSTAIAAAAFALAAFFVWGLRLAV